MPGPKTPPGSPDSTGCVRFEDPPSSPESPQQTAPTLVPYTLHTPPQVEATAVVGAVGAPRKTNKRVRMAVLPSDKEQCVTLVFSPDFLGDCPGAPERPRKKLHLSLSLKNIRPFPLTFDDL